MTFPTDLTLLPKNINATQLKDLMRAQASGRHKIRIRKTSEKSILWECTKCLVENDTCLGRWGASLKRDQWVIYPTVERAAAAHAHQPKTKPTVPGPTLHVPSREPITTINVIWVGGPCSLTKLDENSSLPLRNDLLSPKETQVRKLLNEIIERDQLSEPLVGEVDGVLHIFEPLLMALWATVSSRLHLVKVLMWDKTLETKLDRALLQPTQPPHMYHTYAHAVANNNREKDAETENLVLIGRVTKPPRGTMSRDRLFDKIEWLQMANPRIHVFPTRAESRWDSAKVGDLRVFDSIADQFRNTPDNKWMGFRPRTCNGGLNGVCSLPPSTSFSLSSPTSSKEVKMVVKPVNSAGGAGVRVVPLWDRDKLICTVQQQEEEDAVASTQPHNPTPTPTPTPTTKSSSSWSSRRATKLKGRNNTSSSVPKINNTLDPAANHYFHQEYIESLTTFGELRVIVARTINIINKDLSDPSHMPGVDNASGSRISSSSTSGRMSSENTGGRGREGGGGGGGGGEIIYVALTRPQLESQGGGAGFPSGASRNFTDGSVFASIIPDRASQEAKYKELVAFVSAWYDALLHYSRFHPGFASLQCGVRLDIGMSEATADGRFWVLEATRLTSASSYGQGWCAEASSAWGQAIGVVVGEAIEQSAKQRVECELGAAVESRGKSEPRNRAFIM